MAFSVAEWRELGVQEETLPSGAVAKLRRVHILDLAAEGLIPLTLVAEFETRKAQDGMALLQDIERLREFRDMINAVTKVAFVEPPVGDEATDEQLGVDEVPFGDRMWVFQRGNAGAQKLEPFREEPGADVDDVPGGERVRGETELDPGD